MQRICRELVQHPQIVSLDVSDCELTDQSMEVLCSLLPETGSRPGDLYHYFNLTLVYKVHIHCDIHSFVNFRVSHPHGKH